MENKKLFFVLFISAVLIFSGCSSDIKTIKYRNDSVNINTSAFESVDTSKSSLVRGAWYDQTKEYLIINLQGTNYSYCNVPRYVWLSFKQAKSFGTEYNLSIKGHYSCEGLKQPTY